MCMCANCAYVRVCDIITYPIKVNFYICRVIYTQAHKCVHVHVFLLCICLFFVYFLSLW